MTKTSIDMFDLPCVVLGEDLVKKSASKETMPRVPSMSELVVTLATIRPTWIFSIYADGYNSWGVRIMERGEELGTVRRGWFRGDYGFTVHNHRIERSKSRTSVYRTHDMKKALLAIKKSFALDSVAERVAAASKSADDVMGTEMRNKLHKVRSVKYKLDAEAVEFAFSIMDSFRVFLSTNKKTALLEEYDVAKAEMLTIEAAKKAFDKNETALVLRVDGQYIVKLRDKIEIMDDTLLPSWLRAKVGMLKLVEDEHFISDVGVRINAECFVVLADKEGNQI